MFRDRFAGAGLLIAATLLGLPVHAQNAANPEPTQAFAGPSDYARISRVCSGRAARGFGYQPSVATPVTVRALQPIVPVPATDGFIHLAFAAEVVNVSSVPSSVASLIPIDPLGKGQRTGINSVHDADGNDVTGKVFLFATNAFATALPPGAAGTTFFDIRYTGADALPRLIAIKLATTTGPVTVSAPTDPLVIDCVPPPVLRPPLVGSGWWDGNGCCDIVGPHRGATLPINGTIHAPESFAIDYVQLNASNSCCTGPIHDLASWPYFGAPILAAADGVVIEMQNELPEQVPAEPPVGVTVANAAGNFVIEAIEGGRYFILYAHLKTGSIPPQIKVGTRLRAGQQIGQLGNSGSTTAPHLHFQVMDRPSALDASGLPFVFTSQQLQGTVKGTLAGADSSYESGQPVTVDRSTNGWQAYRMPVETQVFGYSQTFSEGADYVSIAAQPENVGDAAAAALAYRKSGAYEAGLATVDGMAAEWLRSRAPHVMKAALVLDIDETALSNWKVITRDDFGRPIVGGCDLALDAPCGWAAWDQLGRDPGDQAHAVIVRDRKEPERGSLLHHRAPRGAACCNRAQSHRGGLHRLH